MVTVYVRLGQSKGERVLSLQRVPEIPQEEWLKRGFAFDGNALTKTVQKDGERWSLHRVEYTVQLDLLNLLVEYGYSEDEVHFQ